MSKDSHAFNISVACEVGVSGAIMMQHFLFLQKSNIADGENWQQKWVRRSAKSIAKTYPYWSGKQISSIADNLEKGEYIFSKIENASKIDRTKSYILTAKGLLLMGEIPFAQMENGFSKKGNAIAETENAILPNGEMLIKVDYTSFVPSFVEGENASLFSSSENQISLEDEKEKKGLQDGAARLTLEPPFSHVATIEPQQPRIVRLNDPELPGVELIEPAPKPRNTKNRHEPEIHPENETVFGHFTEPERTKTVWKEWLKYKWAEHKQRYRDAKSELTALRKIWKTMGGDSERFSNAVEHSISNLYKGIFESKENTQNARFNKAQQQHANIASYLIQRRQAAFERGE